MKSKNKKYKDRKGVRLFIAGIIVSIALSSLAGVFLLRVAPAQAGIPTSVIASIPDTVKYIWDVLKYVAENAAAVAWKKSYSYFINKIAYDTAVYVASGGQGQKPLFIRDFGSYVKEIGDGAAGEFLDNISQSFFGQSLCTFSPEIQLKLTVYARRVLEPEQPFDCSLSQIGENVTRISKMTTADLINFQHYFNYQSNEIGAFLSLVTEADEQKLIEQENLKLQQTASSFLPLKDPITGEIKTPSEYVGSVVDKSIALSTEAESTYTGKPLADFIDIFTNTLISRLYQNIFEKGIAPSSVGYGTANNTTSGIAAAKQYNRALAKPSFRTRGAIDILNTLASCPADFKEVNNCVIDDDFRAAVDQQLTVKEALEQGLLKGDRTFGFDATGQEPEYYNGYPYRSLVILRKYRIVPSTWEAAALYIKNFVSPATTFGLQELIDLYDVEPTAENGYNPFYHMIDPYWVLKSPETFCRREGPGPELLVDDIEITDDTDGDGDIDQDDTPSRIVSRNTYCADERTCIEEDADGNCKFYGYCTEEKPIWKFDGESCEDYENTCQTFITEDNQEVTYAQSTVNYDSCVPEVGGCRWYCEDYDNNIEGYTCGSEDYLISGNKVYLDNDAQQCKKNDSGCDEYIRIIPGTNLVANSSFEVFEGTPDDGAADDFTVDYSHWDWINNGLNTYARAIPYDGDYSLYTDGGDSIEYRIDVGKPVYGETFSASIYALPATGCDSVEIQIGGDHFGGPELDNYVNPGEYAPATVAAGGWHRVIVKAKLGTVDVDPQPDKNPNQVGIKIIPNGCEMNIDAVQLELEDTSTYVNYASTNQLYETDQSENYLSNGSFSIDRGVNYYADWDQDNYTPGDLQADGWVGTTIIDNIAANPFGGFGDIYVGSGGYQDVPVDYGSRYDVFGWVANSPDAPITTVCLDSEHDVIAEDCNLNADAADPRTQVSPISSGWTWVDFGVEADHPDAAYVRVQLNAGFFDEIGVADSNQSLACRIDEVGCELYDPAEEGDKVPGVVTAQDYCSEEYDGCKSYKQMPISNGADVTAVERSGVDPVYLIAKSAQQCDATYVGCEEYTNLDIVDQGGEGLEYYTYIRQCEKPNAGCTTYFHWEGDDINGFELVSESLVEGAGGAPDTWDGSGDCDPAESGCILYYHSVSGNFWYRMNTSTITCSEDCHPLRNTLDGQVYNAIPEQGNRCPASQAGCREYRGSDGYNIRRLLEDDFEDGDSVGWTNSTISTESLKAGGLSALIEGGGTETDVTDLVAKDKSYILEFWAKSVSDTSTIQATFSPSLTVFAGQAEANNQNWNHFVLGPAHFEDDVNPVEALFILGTSSFYIDNIILWEVRGYNYLIYQSYDLCPASMAGCSLYYDREGDEHYLRSFSSLCRPEKVGCEAAIETFNSTNPFQTETKQRTTMSDLTRPTVNKESNQCLAANKGCSAIGLPTLDLEGRPSEYKTQYLIDNPDDYNSTLCNPGQASCDHYEYDEEENSYTDFKNPQSQLCEYRNGVNVLGTVYDGWFKKGTDEFCPVKKYTCVGDDNQAGNVCFGPEDPDSCGASATASCQEYLTSPQPARVCGPQQQEYCRGGYHDGAICNSQASAQDPVLGCDDPNSDNDGLCSDLTEVCYGGPRAGEACDSDADPTGAYGCASGGENDGYCAERVCQTDNYCASDNTITCQVDSDCPGVDDECLNDECPDDLLCSEYWAGECRDDASGCTEYRDPQDPQPSLAYEEGQTKVCAGGANNGFACTVNDDCDSGACVFQGCNAQCRVEYDTQGNFYRVDEDCNPYPHDWNSDEVLLPGCEPYFNKEQTTDTASCYGVVNEDEGCMLFNDTSSTQGLIYDSDITYATMDEFRGSPYQCTNALNEAEECSQDSNLILKVRRDRVCNEWLYCKTSYTFESEDGQSQRLCYDIGNCQQMGSTGQCTKPVGEGQCDNDPGRACLLDSDCENNGVCVRSPQFEHPALPDVEYQSRAVTELPHPTDLTFDHQVEVDQTRYFSGYSKIGMSWRCYDYDEYDIGTGRCSRAPGVSCYTDADCEAGDNGYCTCWRDGICEGGNSNGALCYADTDCPGGSCTDDQCPGENNKCRVVHGYYPTASMWEVGIGLDLPNHDFEYGSTYPWEQRGLNPPTGNIYVITDDQDPTRENHVLQIHNPQAVDTGGRINLDGLVFDGQRFVINLKLRADSDIPVNIQLCYNDDAGPCQSFGVVTAKHYWQYFTIPQDEPLVVNGVSGNTYLSIVTADGTTGVDIYVDDIELQTLLEKKSTNNPVEATSDERFVVRSCRLYPESDSLQCDYTKESTTEEKLKIYRGWKGYCLEKDPHNEDICLQWWPVDIISGETDVFGSGEIVGYFGRAPLYYCGQITPLEFRRPFWLSGGYCYKANNYHCPNNYYRMKCQQKKLNNWPDKCQYICIPNGIPSNEACNYCKGDEWCGGIISPRPGYWAPFDGQLEHTHKWNEFGLNYQSEVLGLRCDLVVQTVTPTSDNKAWAQRINGGYPSVWDIGWEFTSDLQPYGSLVPPQDGVGGNDVNDPTTWDSEYTSFWGDPFIGNGVLGNENQPIYWLSPDLLTDGQASSFDWDFSKDHGFNEVDYQNLARAGSPYSCRDHQYWMCPVIASNRFHANEQFSGPINPGPPDPDPTEGGFGLKRLQRLFVDAYGLWIWGDGDCVDIVSNHCTYLPEDHVWEGRGCDDESDCDVPEGECIGKVCELSGDSDPIVFEGCGCEEGSCEASYVCYQGGVAGRYCGLGACTGDDDACMSMRCAGGEKDGEVCTDVDNNCSTGETCLTAAGTQCVDDSHQTCECPSGQCIVTTFCADSPTTWCNGNDLNCSRHCDQNGDGNGEYPGSIACSSDQDCEDFYGDDTITCEVVPGICNVGSQRCSNDIDETCSIANNCEAGYKCNNNLYCVDPNINNCECPGTGAYCADGLCTGDDTVLCASNNTPTDNCPGALGTCESNWDICKESATRCDCYNEGSCTLREICNVWDPTIPGYPQCGDTVCDGGRECCDAICEGGGTHETLGKDGKCCISDAGAEPNCTGVDDEGNPAQGICRAAICSSGVYAGQGCGNSDFCIGADGECETYDGVCIGGSNDGDPCNADGQCDSNQCAFNVCYGGLVSGTECSNPNNDAECNPYNDPACDPDDPSYCLDAGVGASPLVNYHQDFEDMIQCRFYQPANASDIRPGTYPEDFCWVQPVVFNIKVNGRTGTVQVADGQGTVNLTFNTLVDPEQIPIRTFWIDWGDGSPVSSFPFAPLGRAPRSDPNGPYHNATHEYVGGTCPAAGCVIRVWMQDNWEYGSGYCESTGEHCANDTQCAGQCWGVCRDATNEFASCRSNADCAGANSYCAGVFDGIVQVVIP